MRLTCPNCGAQYEVPDDVIPEAGRDVQCSNCGDTWYQAHPDHAAPGEDGDEVNAAGDMPRTGDWQTDDSDDTETAREQPAPPAAEDFAPPAEPDQSSDSAPAADGGDTPKPRDTRPERREIDPSVASVLREEAEREARARAAQRSGLETQADLGLDGEGDEARRAREAKLRMARMRGEETAPTPQSDDDDADDALDIDPTSRRSLFPDIEEINSSLAPENGAQAGGAMVHDPYPEAGQRPRGGFRRGFLTAVLIAVALLLIYIFATPLAGLLPALDGVLADYTAWVDGLRLWLDGQMAALMLWLDGLTAPSGG